MESFHSVRDAIAICVADTCGIGLDAAPCHKGDCTGGAFLKGAVVFPDPAQSKAELPQKMNSATVTTVTVSRFENSFITGKDEVAQIRTATPSGPLTLKTGAVFQKIITIYIKGQGGNNNPARLPTIQLFLPTIPPTPIKPMGFCRKTTVTLRKLLIF